MKIYVDKDTKQIKAFERYGNLIFEGDSFSDENCDVFDIAENTKDYLIWYKYVDGELLELTPEEKSELYPEQSKISDIELLKAQIQAISDRNDFIEDCIAEMAMEVYQ